MKDKAWGGGGGVQGGSSPEGCYETVRGSLNSADTDDIITSRGTKRKEGMIL